MSRGSITLKADGRKVRCAANKQFAVAVPETEVKLQVTKRTDDLNVVLAELRKQARQYPRRKAYLFDLTTGEMVYERSPGWPLADYRLLYGYVLNARKVTQGGQL
jgi:hypothetical protein